MSAHVAKGERKNRSPLRRFIDVNVQWSRAIDGLLPHFLRVDGNKAFQAHSKAAVMGAGGHFYDLGGGARPFLSVDEKRDAGMFVTGVDISAAELAAAPAGSYDEQIAVDLCSYVGRGDGDVAVCQATLEHVRDIEAAIAAIASCLKIGGRAHVFAPSRNAVFARLNVVLPQRVKERMLFVVFPAKASGHEGFPAHYNRCTPAEVEAIALKHGLEVEERKLYWVSSYFFFFVPAYLCWRAIQSIAWLFMQSQAAETFSFVFRRTA